MKAWRHEQQALVTSAARDEERSISGWWRQEAEQLWALQSQRRRDHVELATRQEAELAARENKGADVRLAVVVVSVSLLLLLLLLLSPPPPPSVLFVLLGWLLLKISVLFFNSLSAPLSICISTQLEYSARGLMILAGRLTTKEKRCLVKQACNMQ